jgi:hypothetical protein
MFHQMESSTADLMEILKGAPTHNVSSYKQIACSFAVYSILLVSYDMYDDDDDECVVRAFRKCILYIYLKYHLYTSSLELACCIHIPYI